jgi:hypothetical protein
MLFSIYSNGQQIHQAITELIPLALKKREKEKNIILFYSISHQKKF